MNEERRARISRQDASLIFSIRTDKRDESLSLAPKCPASAELTHIGKLTPNWMHYYRRPFPSKPYNTIPGFIKASTKHPVRATDLIGWAQASINDRALTCAYGKWQARIPCFSKYFWWYSSAR